MAEPEFYTSQQIADATQTSLLGDGGRAIQQILTDSRRLIFPAKTLFFALKTESNNGHRYIAELYKNGVRAFVVAPDFNTEAFSDAAFLLSENVLATLQKLAAFHRNKFAYPVVGITGSNGKTVVKEWLFKFLQPRKKVVRNPRSYNSQLGVPLSLWHMGPQHEIAIFEAGISRQDEMLKLRDMIAPNVGVFTNIGLAHAQGFKNIEAKAFEKAQLFSHCEKIVFCADSKIVKRALLEVVAGDENRLLGWSLKGAENAISVSVRGNEIEVDIAGEKVKIQSPFTDHGSIENLLNAFFCAHYLGQEIHDLIPIAAQLQPIEMRLEERKAIHGNLLINDFYNADRESVLLAIDLLMQQPKSRQKIVVLSEFEDIPEREKIEAYKYVVTLLNGLEIDGVVGVGRDLEKAFVNLKHPNKVYPFTSDLVSDLANLNWRNAAILLKGGRNFGFEKIASALQEQVHQTWLEVNLSAMAHNLRFYRQQISPKTKLMAMVKALSYGAGSTEIARLLSYNNVDYLAVAYIDEGVALRQSGVDLPIMVINADKSAYPRMLEYNLEPEIFSLSTLKNFIAEVEENYTGAQPFPIHLKMETGMHRLGFEKEDLAELKEIITRNKAIKVASIFSHLAASDDPDQDDFTRHQLAEFKEIAKDLVTVLSYKPLLHTANTSGMARFPEAQLDMVRLGIGLYGAANSVAERRNLEIVSRWMTRVSQIKNIKPGDSVGYGRSFMAEKPTTIATLPVGYADGFYRSLSNGKGHVFVAGKKVPVVGRVCMDMVMIDITGLNVKEGDVVELMGKNITPHQFAKASGTIAYEILTHISLRVPRVYVTE